MRLLIQRVSQASVTIHTELKANIGKGLLVFIGICNEDDLEDINWFCNKLINLRIFDDDLKIPNLSVQEIDGEILLVSQFTLFASTKKGNRPSYIQAARPEHAIPLYEAFIKQLQNLLPNKIQTGSFGANMQVALINDGPITIWIDSKNRN